MQASHQGDGQRPKDLIVAIMKAVAAIAAALASTTKTVAELISIFRK